MDFRCVECGFRIGNNKTLFVQYSPGNIRLMKRENCKAVADEFIECEIMILLIDLILHKPKAYEHLLHNLLKSTRCEFRGLVLEVNLGFSSSGCLWIFWEGLVEHLNQYWYKDILLGIFISSYFKVFLIAMMVWQFPSSVLFIIDIFVLSSNTVALKVITQSSIYKCIGACFSAHAVKLFVGGVLDIICQDHSDYLMSSLPNAFEV